MKNLSIRIKLIILVMGVMLLSIFSAAWLEYIRVVSSSKEQMVEHSTITANLLGDLSLTYMLFDDKIGASEELKKFRNFKNVIYGAIYDKSGNIFASYKSKASSLAVPAVISHNSKTIIEEGDVWTTQIPIVEKGDLLAYIQVAYSTEKLKKIRDEFIYSVLKIILIISVIAFLLTVKLQEFIYVPIVKLRDSMKDIAISGRYDINLKKYANDELGSLYDGFNVMMRQLFMRKNELLDLNKTLENRVHTRTKELQISLDTLQSTQTKMIEAEKMAALGGLVAGVAHEINTPIGLSVTGITHLKDMTDNLKKLYDKHDMSQDDFEDYLSTSVELNQSIYINLRRAAELVQSFKKIAVDQSIEGMYTFELRERIEHVIISFRSKFKQTNISINLDCDKSLKIFSDPGAIAQIFTNLLTNSLIHGFSKKDFGRIDIKVYSDNNNIHIIYKDNGKGIEESTLPKIFNPFFTTNREAGGTGLGLHIIYNIVSTQLGGTIQAKSILNNGVEFEIVLKQERDI